MPDREPLVELFDLVPPALAAFVAILGYVGVRALFDRQQSVGDNRTFRRQVWLSVTVLIGILIVLIAIPSATLRGQLLALFGILLSAAIALSSTTLVGNAMAGLMLRGVRPFRAGDFVRVGDFFGRVTERGLVHTEIQTEDRDLVTLPNLYLISNPVRVVRPSGTIVSASVSLGYDVAHADVEEQLLVAAGEVGLEEPFVRVDQLGDYSVLYRVAGLLRDVKSVLITRSELRAAMLDALHGAGIEIVSPSFMNQRPLNPEQTIMPPIQKARAEHRKRGGDDRVLFDKAEQAAKLEDLRAEHKRVDAQIAELEKAAKDAGEGDEREAATARIARLSAIREQLAERIALREEMLESTKEDS